MRISDWSSDVCSSVLRPEAQFHDVLMRIDEPLQHHLAVHIGAPVELFRALVLATKQLGDAPVGRHQQAGEVDDVAIFVERDAVAVVDQRSEEHTSELQSLMRISYAVFCLKKTTPNLYNLLQKTT